MPANDTTNTFAFAEQAEFIRAGALAEAQAALRDGKPPQVVVEKLSEEITKSLVHLQTVAIKLKIV